jgi:hypothetical protein
MLAVFIRVWRAGVAPPLSGERNDQRPRDSEGSKHAAAGLTPRQVVLSFSGRAIVAQKMSEAARQFIRRLRTGVDSELKES